MRSLVVFLAAAAISVAGGAAYADSPRTPCVPDGYLVTSVAAHAGGAEIRVVPEFELGVEWLRYQIDRRVTALDLRRTADCVMDVPSIAVDVEAKGAGFVVVVRASDDDGAREVLRRARTLVASSSRPAPRRTSTALSRR